ncbi:reverse transcriptase [Senna tora]|uniref:Reverse transcriptase n=1 Tax=Senna tora TaxID=362788 RepID=A0A834WJM5_9FABA|nr:reverse transcriptase [Senna tora]
MKLSDEECPLCSNGAESVEYLFFECDRVRAVWFGSQFHLKNVCGSSGTFLCWIEEKFDQNGNILEGISLDPAATINSMLMQLWI